jgi:hypothetical protein
MFTGSKDPIMQGEILWNMKLIRLDFDLVLGFMLLYLVIFIIILISASFKA